MWENIEKLLISKNLSANEVGMKTGISPQLFYMWKQGKAKPSMDSLEKLSKFFEVPFSYWTTGELVEENKNFTNDDLLLARELNKSDKLDLIKDIIRIQKESDINMLKEMTKIFLERK